MKRREGSEKVWEAGEQEEKREKRKERIRDKR
jgi:hypothetical protein